MESTNFVVVSTWLTGNDDASWQFYKARTTRDSNGRMTVANACLHCTQSFNRPFNMYFSNNYKDYSDKLLLSPRIVCNAALVGFPFRNSVTDFVARS